MLYCAGVPDSAQIGLRVQKLVSFGVGEAILGLGQLSIGIRYSSVKSSCTDSTSSKEKRSTSGQGDSYVEESIGCSSTKTNVKRHYLCQYSGVTLIP